MMMTTKGADNHDKPDPTKGGKIREEGQGKEEGLGSAEDVHRAAVQVDNSNVAFLLMVEATVATATTLLSTIASGALPSWGAGTMMIILELFSP